MEKPVIGIMPQIPDDRNIFRVTRWYWEALLGAGAMPFMLPPNGDEAMLRYFIARCDGLLFAGGGDIEPARYGEETLAECGELYPPRDENELLALKIALERDMPILGICRGEQLINVGMGGTLYQDIPSQLDDTVVHNVKPYDGVQTHWVDIVPDSALEQVVKTRRLFVNSYHHQAVKNPAPGMEIMAYSENGVIEAYRFPQRRFLWGIQWHPEMSYTLDEESKRIFEVFLNAAGEMK